ncbi:unnamed protein product [Lepeophtheirus salmonis]|uniref:(salmon louse) hypothetical protein n=1 Tax=Lepeophtheirus salmonis TaxID=72036 RepID=A0A7R8D5E3_LEPSM|nr:unnamed protein product [Lepeophtheirus salmonis]CAF3035080.1 unnamed protein product [Lepeophtheirus salmonis]
MLMPKKPKMSFGSRVNEWKSNISSFFGKKKPDLTISTDSPSVDLDFNSGLKVECDKVDPKINMGKNDSNLNKSSGEIPNLNANASMGIVDISNVSPAKSTAGDLRNPKDSSRSLKVHHKDGARFKPIKTQNKENNPALSIHQQDVDVKIHSNLSGSSTLKVQAPSIPCPDTTNSEVHLDSSSKFSDVSPKINLSIDSKKVDAGAGFKVITGRTLDDPSVNTQEHETNELSHIVSEQSSESRTGDFVALKKYKKSEVTREIGVTETKSSERKEKTISSRVDPLPIFSPPTAPPRKSNISASSITTTTTSTPVKTPRKSKTTVTSSSSTSSSSYVTESVDSSLSPLSPPQK